MSLYDQIKEEHLFYAEAGPLYRGSQCVCDGEFYNWDAREEEHEAHVIAEFEKALRTQIAADIRQASIDMEDAADTFAVGSYSGTVALKAEGMSIAARIAEEGTTK